MNRLDKDYLQLLQDIIDFGVDKMDRTGTGCKSLFGYTIRHNMRNGFPLLTTKKMHWPSIVSELIWFLRGDTNIKWLLEQNNNIWVGDAYKNYCLSYKDGHEFYEDETVKRSYTKEEFVNKIKTDDEFAKKWGELGPIYGKQWRSWSGASYINPPSDKDESIHQQWYRMGHNSIANKTVDQITNLINELKTNPDSRRLMVSAWNVAELDKMVLPPCHNLFQMYSVEKNNKRYLSIMVNIRSNDVPLGLPFNIASYALLLEIIARLTNMIAEEVIINIGDAHIYLNQMDGVKEQLNREPFELPKLVISNQVNFNEGIDEFLNSCLVTDFQVENYQSHPSIKLPLSN